MFGSIANAQQTFLLDYLPVTCSTKIFKDVVQEKSSYCNTYFFLLFLDSNTSYLEEGEVSRPPSSDEMDFDALLRLSQKGLQNRKESCRGR